jgi:hypothetical protein
MYAMDSIALIYALDDELQSPKVGDGIRNSARRTCDEL